MPSIRELAKRLGSVARGRSRIYLTGGATAVLEGWRERSPLAFRAKNVDVHHFDFYSQALSKIERGLVEPVQLRKLYEAIEPMLYKYPAIDPAAFRRKVEQVLGTSPK